MSDKRLTVTVTADDIREGEQHDCWGCPVAMALSRAVGDDVHVYYSRMSDGGGQWSRALPLEAVDFQRRFDVGEPVEPFTFKARVPDWYVRA